MKRILAFLLSLLPVLASAQDEAFSIDGSALIWRKVYDAATTAELVAHNLQASGHFYDIQASDGLVTAEMRGVQMLYKDLGYKRMSLPLYVVNDTYSAFLTVQIKEDRYRVTLERISTHNVNYGAGLLDRFAIDGAALSPAFLDRPARIASYTFDALLSGLDKNSLDDEW